jgi:MFS family permease
MSAATRATRVGHGRLAAARRSGILPLAVLICLTDVVNGVVAPTFTLYARSLGASIALIGVLSAVVGVTRLVTSIPAGALADRVGRRAVIVVGVLLFGGACALFTASRDPAFLVVPRILFGLAMVSTFAIGVAYVADRTTGRSRDLAISAYVSAQGVGYALGPLVAGVLATWWSTASIYRAMAVLAGCVAAYGWLTLDSGPSAATRPQAATARGPAWRQLRRRSLVGVSVANFAMILMFSGSLVPFLALLGSRRGLGHQAIAILYGARAGASTITRLPAGMLARRLTNTHLLLGAVAVDSVAALAIGIAPSAMLIVAAVIVDGVAFGTFLGASQSYIAETTDRAGLGAALGVYSMAGSVGETLGAASMGAVAALSGVAEVFRLDALILLVAAVGSFLLLRRAP